MAKIGKLLVLANLALSLFMMTAGFAAYSSGVDWTDFKGNNERPPGKLAPVKAEIADLSKQGSLAYASYTEARNELLDAEQRRQASRANYATQLQLLETSKVPVHTVTSDGQVNPVAAEESPGVPLMSLSFYAARIGELRAENTRVRQELEKTVNEDAALTRELTGTPDGRTKGLRRQIVEERDKGLGLVSEEGITEGMRVNALVEAQLILKRLDSVNESVQQLEKYLKLKHGVGAAKK